MDISRYSKSKGDNMEEMLKDLYKSERQHSRRLMIFNYVLIAICAVLFTVCMFLTYTLLQYEKVEITTETYEQTIDGDDGSIINGNQYNDNATHNQGSEIDGEGETEEDQNYDNFIQEEGQSE